MFDDDITDHRIGFVGIGNMGFGMAKNVLEAGFPVSVFDVRGEPLEEFAALGGSRADSAFEVARNCRSVHVVVRDDEQADSVARGDQGLFDGFEESTEEKLLVVHSTVLPETCRTLAEDAPSNVAVIDAPVSGAMPRANAGDLTIMVGGEEHVVDYCRPVLEPMARQVFHIGEIGTGQVTKLANNATSLSNMMATAEGLALGEEYGVDRDTLLEVFEESSANSFMVQNWKFFLENADDVHPGGFEAAAEISEKDLYEALELARNRDVDLAGTAVAAQQVPSLFREKMGKS